jgi:uncharacterized membrane protein required for colicin V production
VLIDVIIVAATIGVAVWGYIRGFSAGGLALIGFGVGVVLGSRVAPLLLDGGLRDPYAPVMALTGALLFGAIIAAVLERFAFRVRRPMLRRPLLDGIAGAAVAVCLGMVVVWALGALAVRVKSLRHTVTESTVVDNLNAILPPAGPLLHPVTEFTPLPVIAGPSANVGPTNPEIKRDKQVKRAARSVVKVTSVACGHTVSGSGWIARPGVVVTNAHVVAGSEDIRVQVEGEGKLLNARPIWYDDKVDVAVLRVSPTGSPRLRVARTSRPGTFAAVLGFPGGGQYEVRPARVGRTAQIAGRKVENQLLKRKVTSMRAIVLPGNSGGPVVDDRGRVVTMVFAGQKHDEGGSSGHTAYGVPLADIRIALKRAGQLADTGDCNQE